MDYTCTKYRGKKDQEKREKRANPSTSYQPFHANTKQKSGPGRNKVTSRIKRKSSSTATTNTTTTKRRCLEERAINPALHHIAAYLQVNYFMVQEWVGCMHFVERDMHVWAGGPASLIVPERSQSQAGTACTRTPTSCVPFLYFVCFSRFSTYGDNGRKRDRTL